MVQKPKIGLVQFDVKLGNPRANIDHVRRAIQDLADQGVNLAVLPEMWSCGFDYSALKDHAAQTPAVLDELCSLAENLNLAVSGTMPELTPDGVYNTHYYINEKGSVQAEYRKVHRFTPAGEGEFEPGARSVLAAAPWGKTGLLTCYDLRFPEQSRALVLAGAIVLIVSAQWPAVRIRHWDVLLQARAVENQAFVIACNRCGKDPELVYGGRSAVISPWGEVIAGAGGGETLLTAALNLYEVKDFRTRIPCLEHRIPEAYDLENIVEK
ncbi:carbon-nitrogen family hydrolase [Desulfatibacillum aliphaticivorans]|uniref:carbon-nitrogen family hydrolase n=1 Tax=Desulfatibacillum aliphaticivorans TaxID=218208 RepID=UPI0005C1940B|nr:carbon-nitrogen family hydrolase [Desulfatibacillum aliphaticivorans]